MAAKNPHIHFLGWLCAYVVLGLVLVAALVILVDPYRLYRVIDRAGLNQIKPYPTRYQSQIKLTLAQHWNADVLIFGNSRAEVGLDPEASAFRSRGLSAVNLAVPGVGIGVSRDQFSSLLASGARPRVVILGMEFLDYMEAKPRHLAQKSTGTSRVDDWFWRSDLLFSLTSVMDAITTLSMQNDPDAEILTDRGFNPLNNYLRMGHNEGFYNIFSQKAEANARTFLRKRDGSLNLSDLQSLRIIIDLAAKNGCELKLLIYPYHAQVFALFDEIGLTSDFERWKAAVVAELARGKARHPQLHISLHDFSGFGPLNCEHIPAKGDRVTVPFGYWEGGHFRKELGDIVLDRLMSGDLAGYTASFGQILNEATLVSNRQRIDEERRQCQRNYPELFRDVQALVHSLGGSKERTEVASVREEP